MSTFLCSHLGMHFTPPSIIATGHGIPLISVLLSRFRGPKRMVYPWDCSYSDEFTPKASNQCQPLNVHGFCYSRSTMSESTIVLITGKIPVAPVSCTFLTSHRRQLRYWLCNSSNSCVPVEIFRRDRGRVPSSKLPMSKEHFLSFNWMLKMTLRSPQPSTRFLTNSGE